MNKRIIYLCLLLVPVLFLTGCSNENTNNEEEDWFTEVECTVEDKWVKRNDDIEKYLVSCDDEVYQITDNILYGKFNSSDLYAKLKIGKKYKLQISGFRSGIFSAYKNINEIELIGDNE